MSGQTKPNKRALRRHHAQRKFINAYRTYAGWKMEDGPELQKWIRRDYNHLAACSCWMCNHRRKWEGLTIQERRSLLALKDRD